MSDLKVTDRRWWARGEEGAAESGEEPRLKPTYIEELEERLAAKDAELQQILAKYRSAADEFDQARQFLGVLEGLGVTRIDPLGATFDPTRHEAVATAPAPDGVPAGQVVGVIRPGYMMGEDVLRPAMVAVAG
jgi:molecular chaperone GrpE